MRPVKIHITQLSDHHQKLDCEIEAEAQDRPRSVLAEPALEPTLPLISLGRLVGVLADNIWPGSLDRLGLSGARGGSKGRFLLWDLVVCKATEAVFSLGALVQTLLLQSLLLQLVI